MKKYFWAYILIVVLVILAVLFLRRPVHPPANVEQSQATVQSTNESPVANVRAYSQSTPTVAPTPAPTQPLSSNAFVTHKVESPEQAKQEIESANVPVQFYGRFINQDSNVVSGVNIKVVVRHWIMADPISMLAGSKDIQLEQESGIDGRFELTGASGDVFGIESIQKDGYEAEPGKRTFGAVDGSYDNPVIFKMWGTNIHEKLITGNYAFHIVPDGRPYFINLTEGTISESGTGDLKVWIQYTNQVKDSQLHDWSAEIDVNNGGLQAAPDYAMWMAPADGYVPSFQQSGQIKGYQRGNIGERKFYLLLKNGQEYGQMSIGLYAPFNNQTPGLIRLSYAINPSGSSILR